MTRILVCGLTAVDFVFSVSTLPERAEKYVAHNANMILGGGAANAAVAISRQQGCASLAARIGDDWVGKAIMHVLNNENIDCSLLQVCKHASTSFSSVLVAADGERQIVNFRGTGFDDKPDWLTNDIPSKFRTDMHCDRPFDGVLTDTRWTDAAVAVLQMARRAGVPGVVDAEAPISDPILESASHVAFSIQGLRTYTAMDSIEDSLLAAFTKLDAWVCVTDGSNGVFHIQDGKVQHTPAPQVEARDTLAAGDVWHGVFTLGLSEGQQEQHAIEYANAAASLKCKGQETGSMAAPNREQTNKLVQQYYGK